MNEEVETEQVEEIPTESIEETTRTPYTIETPFGDATTTIEVDPTTGEPIEGVTKVDLEALTEIMSRIEAKTVTTNADGSPLAITYEQGEQIINLLTTLETAGITVIVVVFVWYIFRWVYNLFARDFFGGI